MLFEITFQQMTINVRREEALCTSGGDGRRVREMALSYFTGASVLMTHNSILFLMKFKYF